jgi:hypothetical protein
LDNDGVASTFAQFVRAKSGVVCTAKLLIYDGQDSRSAFPELDMLSWGLVMIDV